MAATYADLSRLDAILKDRPVQDALREAINKATPFAERITQTMELSGRKGIFPVTFGVNEGVFARAEKETFGDSQVDSPDLAEVSLKYIYAKFEITGQIINASRDSMGSFEDGLALQLRNTIDGVKLDLARQMIGAGDAKVGLVASVTDTDTVVVDSPFGLTTYKEGRPVRNIVRKNMAMDVLDAATPTTKHGDNQVVSAITHASDSTTIDYAAVDASLTSAADGDFFVRAGNYGNEISGFFAAVATSGTYQGISRTGRPGWQGIILDAAGGGASCVPLDTDHLRDEVDLIMEETGEAPGFLVMNYKQRRNFFNLVQPQMRYLPMSAPQGIRENELTFDDMGVVIERFFPPEHIGIVNPSHWYHVVGLDTEWIQGLNGTVLNWVQNQDLFLASLRTYRNIACLYPATNGYIYGLEE